MLTTSYQLEFLLTALRSRFEYFSTVRESQALHEHQQDDGDNDLESQ